jgi:hypothetical protein
MQAWVMEELASSDIGDERLDRRYQLLLDTLSQKPSVIRRGMLERDGPDYIRRAR